MTGVEKCFKYCEDVESGKILTNKYIKLAVKRFRDDLKKSKSKKYPYYFDEEAANKFCAFCECLKMYKDRFRGQPLILEPWQCFILCNVYGWKDRAKGNRRFKSAFIYIGRKNGKALALDTPINTPNGWKTMGDIHPGDYVYGDNGEPVKVLWESDIHLNHDCYKLTFSNGDEIVADADHLWKANDIVVSTEFIFNHSDVPCFLPNGVQLLSIEKVESVPTKCIAVDNKSHLFCVGKHNTITHNSTMLSTTLLYDLLTTPGAEAYCAATKREQARIILDTVREMVKQNEGLSSRLKYFNSTSRIINQKLAGRIEALSADSKKMDGLNPSCVVVDELAAMKNFDTINVLQSGQGSRESPLFFEITSGSDDIHSAGRQEFEKAAKILEGTFENEEFFTVLYCIDDTDDWKDSKNDIKANPNLGVSVLQSHLDISRKEALQQPAKEGEFRSKCLGQWVSPITAWIDYKTWHKCINNELPPNEGYNISVGAVDLSKRHDFTAYSIYTFNTSTKKFYANHRFYIPEDQVEQKMKRDSPMIRKWIEEGYIVATKGPVIDYTTMYRDIRDSLSYVREVCFDPYNSATLINEIGPLVDLIEVNQSMKNLSPMSKDWEASVINNEIVDNNPVMKWMVSCCSIYVDPNGNIKPVKNNGPKSTDRIDGVITSIMAHGRIKELLKEGVDFRTAEEIQRDMESLLNSLDY